MSVAGGCSLVVVVVVKCAGRGRWWDDTNGGLATGPRELVVDKSISGCRNSRRQSRHRHRRRRRHGGAGRPVTLYTWMLLCALRQWSKRCPANNFLLLQERVRIFDNPRFAAACQCATLLASSQGLSIASCADGDAVTRWLGCVCKSPRWFSLFAKYLLLDQERNNLLYLITTTLPANASLLP